MFRSGNPVLSEEIFKKGVSLSASDEAMTVSGAVNKTTILFLILMIGASLTWYQPIAAAQPWMLVGVFGGLIAALVTVFKKEWAPVSAPIYAFLEGLFLGGISSVYASAYDGLVLEAVTLTFGTFAAMLILYKTGIVKVTEKLRFGIFAATGGIALVYFASMILGFFGISVSLINGTGLFGIGFSLIVVGVAAMNLLLDFDFIYQGAEYNAPKYIEWYAAFGLMVTLIWLYIEFLRLLSKLQSRR